MDALTGGAIRKFIPVAEPVFAGNEKSYVLDCLDTTWISSSGKYIDEFEKQFANYIGVEHAISVCNGTVALHVALLALEVQPGDEVIVPTLTYIATANAVSYCGARPIFVDSETRSWNIDPSRIEEKITPRTKGIIVVHLYGHPVDMEPIEDIATRHGLFILEDAAEAHGAEYKGNRVGSLGTAATFSFYANKIITSGEGGMIVTNDDRLASAMRQIKGQGQDFHQRYWFPIIGYNYRMTNIQAALGLAQLEKIDWHIDRRREVAHWYQERLDEMEGVKCQPELPWAKNVYWMNCLVLAEHHRIDRDSLMNELANRGIETRPFFYPMHVLPPYKSLEIVPNFPVAGYLSKRGLNLPSSAKLTEAEVDFIVSNLKELVR
jgi:perosamine synthetase